LYRAGTIAFFEKDTVVQPDTIYPIKHYDLKRQHLSGLVAILGTMPDDFPAELARAARESITMGRREKQRIAEILGL
jgi:hypothetical protein